MPDPTPRYSAGMLLMTAARLGEPNDAMNSPVKNNRTAKVGYGKSPGMNSRRRKQTAEPTMPPLAKSRAPKRSDRIPEIGPAMSSPAVRGRMAMPAHNGVRSKV